MKKVFLFHGGRVQHYRIGVYNYLYRYLKKYGYNLTVICEDIQNDGYQNIEYPEIRISFSFLSLRNLIKTNLPWLNILFINHSKSYFFPFLVYLRATGNKVVTWTHGLNLQKKSDMVSRMVHHFEHSLCEGIILYSEAQKKYLLRSHQRKSFIANNTLNLTEYVPGKDGKEKTLNRYNIFTQKNVVYSGSIDRRKRIFDLIKAFGLINNEGTGLIIIGPDNDHLLEGIYKSHPRIFYLGPKYGKEALDILSASDVCCIPGAVGLGIVDSMFCGLPLVTEDVDHGPEIMYFKEGINGFMVPKGDIIALSEKLTLLLNNDELRERMGRNARNEILSRGHIESLCSGFLRCLKSLDRE